MMRQDFRFAGRIIGSAFRAGFMQYTVWTINGRASARVWTLHGARSLIIREYARQAYETRLSRALGRFELHMEVRP